MRACHGVVLVGSMVALGGCARAARSPAGDDAGALVDAPAVADGPRLLDSGLPADARPDAAPDAGPIPGGATPLLLSEVVLQPSGGEFVEIVNPGAAPVDLGGYYLSDSGSYWKLPAGAPAVDPSDFIVRFPAGATIPARGVVTVALDTAANFTTQYPGVTPGYSVAGGTMVSVAASGPANLTNGGELVVLFRWDGASDLVVDVDMVIAGAATAANALLTKAGAAQDGPDADAAKSTYAPDANSLAVQPSAPTLGKSTKRIALEAGHETHGGAGNGQAGDDETSEVTSATWDTAFTAPTPGAVPAALTP